MNKRLKFRELRRVLEGFGFQFRRGPNCVLFEHAPSDSVVVLRVYRANEGVNPADLAVARTLLDQRGVVEREAFDNALLTVKA